MDWGSYWWIFLLSSVKFLFAPPAAVSVVSYWEAILVTSCGGMFGVSFFYLLGNSIFRASERRKKAKEIQLRNKGILIIRKKFTRTNRMIVRTKRSFGLIGLCLITPSIISIPIGSVLLSRLYPRAWVTLPVLYVCVIIWSIILTTFGHTLLSWIGLL